MISPGDSPELSSAIYLYMCAYVSLNSSTFLRISVSTVSCQLRVDLMRLPLTVAKPLHRDVIIALPLISKARHQDPQVRVI